MPDAPQLPEPSRTPPGEETTAALWGDALRMIGFWVAAGGFMAAMRMIKASHPYLAYLFLIPIGIVMWLVGRILIARERERSQGPKL